MTIVPEINVRLTVGSTAPDFRTEATTGEMIDLKHYRGKPLLLSFFRNGACALCNLRVHQLIEKYPTYHAQGLEMLAVFESPHSSILEYVGKQDAPFPIIADPTAALYQLYGVEVSEEKVNATMADPLGQQRIQEAAEHGFRLTPEPGSNFYRMPADFLIGPDGKIVEAYYSDLVGQHLSFEAIERHLRG
ncbi:MAG: redoxin domain-containing protein [Anaerolineae bacterium]|nr:redoxin domain-containing protein [Anaerolineae bacterium]